MNHNRQPVAQVGTKAPVRTRQNADGTQSVEKIPALPSRKLVTASGNVISMPYVTGRALGGHNDVSEGSGYGRLKMSEKRARGNLLYAECPYANGSLPVADGIEPCAGLHPMTQEVANELFDHRRPISARNTPMKTVQLNTRGAFWKLNPNAPRYYVEEQCCPHIESIIKARQNKQTEKTADYAQAFKKPDQLYYENRLAEMDAEDAAQSKPRKPRKRSLDAQAAASEESGE